LQSLGLGWDSVDWNRLLTIPSLDASKPDDPAIQARTFILGLRLDLMELPELADIDRIKLDFSLGFFPIGGLWSHTQLHGGLSAVGFHNFDVNLMRFLEVSADEVAIKRVSYTDTNGQSQPSTWLIFAGVRIIILGHVIVDGLVIEIFAAGDEKGFICYWPANTSLPANGILDIDWLLIGHNVEMPTGGTPPFWQTLISPEFDDPDDQIRKRLYQAVDQDKPLFLPRPGGSPTGAWIFAAGFEIFGGLLEGKFLFQDRAYYGIAIGGGLLDELFQGEDTGISVAYIKGASASDDAFAISVHVPTVVLAGFTFLGGVISVEISMGGSFMLDIGFPWLAPDGGREWDRTFGAIVSIGQGSGGGYIQKREIATASGDQLLLSGGYAIQGGLGASFNAAVVTAWVTAGFYAIFEGSVTFQNKQIIDVDVLGAIGILVRGGAELNWWIISVRIEIVASAEARGDLHWTKAQNVAMLQLDFELHVELGAQACIGGGWFKICRGISISLEMDFQQRIRIG